MPAGVLALRAGGAAGVVGGPVRVPPRPRRHRDRRALLDVAARLVAVRAGGRVRRRARRPCRLVHRLHPAPDAPPARALRQGARQEHGRRHQ